MRKISLSFLILSFIANLALADSRPDFAAMMDVKQKKKAFFDYMNDFVQKENNKILKEREIVKTVALGSQELKRLCEKYSKNCDAIDEAKRNALLSRVDIVPPSLALAQSANESAWGTSRFALKGYNYFGQWCYKKGCGIVPARRNAGSSHEVRKFSSGQESVRAYLFNLNTGRAYADLRANRAADRKIGKNPSSLSMSEGLINYSERREHYIKELKSMINYNKLIEKYDTAYYRSL